MGMTPRALKMAEKRGVTLVLSGLVISSISSSMSRALASALLPGAQRKAYLCTGHARVERGVRAEASITASPVVISAK